MTEADRLVAGNSSGPDHRGLDVLLDAATAPPSVEELAGEAAAVARFVAAYRRPVTESATRNRVRVSRSARILAIKVAAGVAVLAAGGTAVAAETGNLPAGVQQLFSALGVPAPDGGPQPTATGAGPTPSQSSASTLPTPAPTPSGAASSPAETETTALGLCRAWDTFRTDPHTTPMPAASRSALATTAGGNEKIADFCAGLLATSASSSTSQPSGSPSSSNDQSSNQGDGDGNGNGDGDGNGKGNGSGQGQPPPTPSPQNSKQRSGVNPSPSSTAALPT